MSRFNKCATALAELVERVGNNNGQRWQVPVLEFIAVLEEHVVEVDPSTTEPAPKKTTKKKAAKKGTTEGAGDDS